MGPNVYCGRSTPYLEVRTAGFTLTELLIVIGIVAVIAGVLTAAFFRARKQAQTTTCVSNMHQLALALTSYVQDYDEQHPVKISANVQTGQLYFTNSGWAGEMMPYVKSTSVFDCPSDSTQSQQYSGSPLVAFPVSYGINPNLIAAGNLSGLAAPGKTVLLFEVAGDCAEISDAHEGDTSASSDPPQVSAAGDGVNGSLSNMTGHGAIQSPGAVYATGALANGYDESDAAQSWNQYPQTDPRHGACSNYLAADGHTQCVAPSLVSAGGNALSQNNGEAGLGCKSWRPDVNLTTYPCAAGTDETTHRLTFSAR